MEVRLRSGFALALVAVALALAGCADGEGSLASSASSHFTPGITTRAEAVAKLGPPSSIYDQANGSRIVSWARTGGLFNPSETRGLSVEFGPDDRMVRIVSGAAPDQ
jgi:hypothetical protein